MIAGKTDTNHIIIGLTDEDIASMRKGLTCVKDGGPDFGVRGIIVFMGKSNEQMIKLLSTATTVRKDNQFPNIGMG